LLTAQVGAATITTQGAGSAVSTIDRSATFDTLTAANPANLNNYTEGGLLISTSGESWASDTNTSYTFDPFQGLGAPDRAFYAVAWGNHDWVTIQTTNFDLMYGVEFMYGNGWTTGNSTYPWGNPNAVLDWQTWTNGVLSCSGTIGPAGSLQMATIVGFYDPAGFDQLLVRATIATSGSPPAQDIALDNLQVMLTNRPPAPDIYGGDFVIDPATHIPSLSVYGTLAGCQYQMVYSESLASAVWNPVIPTGGWQAGGGTLLFSDTNAPGKPRRFYRVEAR
jgi:hypothetical protein